MRFFNVTGICNPEKHYMVDISRRLEEIKVLVDGGKYFSINRGRQYGKTTTLTALGKYLSDEYYVLSLDFQAIGSTSYTSESKFVYALAGIILDLNEFSGLSIPDDIISMLKDIETKDVEKLGFGDVFRVFLRWCKASEKPVVLIIDEIDSAANNQVFLDFLAQLRLQYISRENNADYRTFQSVILAGVNDVKYLKSKIRDEEQHKVNSHWNIATDFDIDMSLSKEGIKGMLDDYSSDKNVVMDTADVAKYIYDYTGGYPFLVSMLCKLMDESKEIKEKIADTSKIWTGYGVDEAVRILLKQDGVSLFESLTGKVTNYPEIKSVLYDILIGGKQIAYNTLVDSLAQMKMHGFIKDNHGVVAISNRIFETLLYNLIITEEELKSNAFTSEGALAKNIFIKDGKLDMRLILERFRETYTQIFGPLEERFKEKDGREQFLLYLKPIINGTGNYYIEAQTRNQTRTNVIVDYLGQQYIIELKIWRGDRYNEEGEKQLSEYLDYFNLDTGYMLSFNFNKNKETGMKRITFGNKVLFEEVI